MMWSGQKTGITWFIEPKKMKKMENKLLPENIRVTKCRLSNEWYAQHINQILKVARYQECPEKGITVDMGATVANVWHGDWEEARQIAEPAPSPQPSPVETVAVDMLEKVWWIMKDNAETRHTGLGYGYDVVNKDRAAQSICSYFKEVLEKEVVNAMNAFSLWRTANKWYWYEVMQGVEGWSTDDMKLGEVLTDHELYKRFLQSLNK